MQSKNSIAMLTSFNEINLAKVATMRKELGEQFEKDEWHQARLHELSSSRRRARRSSAIRSSTPRSTATTVIYHGYQDISVAVSTDKGLVDAGAARCARA
jgi:2-oxoglutarate dehydrogenase E2 component (dihydrolipoamide succinyltransferase)